MVLTRTDKPTRRQQVRRCRKNNIEPAWKVGKLHSSEDKCDENMRYRRKEASYEDGRGDNVCAHEMCEDDSGETIMSIMT